MDVQVFDLPTLTENTSIHDVEIKFCEMSSRYRNGDGLDEVEITWFDSANTWLSLI